MTASSLQHYFEQRRVSVVTMAPGIAVPRRFTHPEREHVATRQAAGLFDFSFMGCAEIDGAMAGACLDHLQTRNLAGLGPGRIAYTLLLREDGSVLSDATVWNLGSDRFAVFTGRRADVAQIRRLAWEFSANVTDRSSRHAVIAVQGPHARRVLADCFAPEPLPDLPYYGFADLSIRQAHCWLARIGYSGEAGYELIVPAAAASALWHELVAAGGPHGLLECGFEAADTLRIEAGHLLFSRELAAPVSPVELGLERLVDNYGRSFYGSRVPGLRTAASRRLAGLLPYARGGVTPDQLRSAMEITSAQVTVDAAVMTSACFSPTLQEYVGIGFVSPGACHPGAIVTVGNGLNARVARLPFYDPAKHLARRSR